MPQKCIDTKVGPVLIEGDGRAITRVRIGKTAPDASDLLIDEAAAQIVAYFAGTRATFDLPLTPAASARGQALLGDALARVGESKAARTAWLAAAGMNEPGVKQVRALTERNLKVGEQAERQRDYARAERAYRRAALLQPDNVAALRGWASAFVKLGSPRLALVQAERSVTLAEKDARNWLMLGEVQTALGNTAEAKRALQRAMELGSPSARQRLKRLD